MPSGTTVVNMSRVVLSLLFLLVISVEGVINEPEKIDLHRIEERNNYIQQFFEAIGDGIHNFLAMPSSFQKFNELVHKTAQEKKRLDDDGTPVKLPLCPVSSDKCRTTTGEPLTCGKPAPHGRVVNGSNVAQGAHPWAVQIRTKHGKLFCSGTLVSVNYVVTASHCFNRLRPSDVFLVIGNVFSDGTESPFHEVNIFCHQL